MDPTKNNEGEDNTTQYRKLKKWAAWIPPKPTRRKTTQHNTENKKDGKHGPHQKQQGGTTQHNTEN